MSWTDDIAENIIRRMFPRAEVEVYRHPAANRITVRATYEQRDLLSWNRLECAREMHRDLVPTSMRRKPASRFWARRARVSRLLRH